MALDQRSNDGSLLKKPVNHVEIRGFVRTLTKRLVRIVERNAKFGESSVDNRVNSHYVQRDHLLKRGVGRVLHQVVVVSDHHLADLSDHLLGDILHITVVVLVPGLRESLPFNELGGDHSRSTRRNDQVLLDRQNVIDQGDVIEAVSRILPVLLFDGGAELDFFDIDHECAERSRIYPEGKSGPDTKDVVELNVVDAVLVVVQDNVVLAEG